MHIIFHFIFTFSGRAHYNPKCTYGNREVWAETQRTPARALVKDFHLCDKINIWMYTDVPQEYLRLAGDVVHVPLPPEILGRLDAEQAAKRKGASEKHTYILLLPNQNTTVRIL